MKRKREKLKRQRRPEFFLYWLKRHWVDNRSAMIVILSGRRESGRPRGIRSRG